jgi:hypothetical protein
MAAKASGPPKARPETEAERLRRCGLMALAELLELADRTEGRPGADAAYVAARRAAAELSDWLEGAERAGPNVRAERDAAAEGQAAA